MNFALTSPTITTLGHLRAKITAKQGVFSVRLAISTMLALFLVNSKLNAAPSPTQAASFSAKPSFTYSVKYIDKVYEAKNIPRTADVPIVFKNGVLFTYYSHRSANERNFTEKLYVSGEFVAWRFNIAFTQGPLGIYYVFVPINLAVGTYTYRFLHEKLWINDPQQFYQTLDPLGKPISTFQLPRPITHYDVSPVKVARGMYTFYLEDKDYAQVHWLGTANLWNPYNDPLHLEAGYWRITKYLSPAAPYYAFLIDGVISLDPLNIRLAYSSFYEEVSVVNDPNYFIAK